MIAFDTNVLLRLLLEDHAEQAARAREAVETARASDETILINDVVLAETMWTLARRYKATKRELMDLARGLFDSPSFAFESRDILDGALDLFETSSADFADCLIVSKNAAIGARKTLSFDEDFEGLPATQLL